MPIAEKLNAKSRSPRYPAIGLSEAIEKIRHVYRRDHQNRIPREVVAKHMGYTGLNGKSLGVLSTLGKYGLLEGRGEETRVSDLALALIAHEPNTEEWKRAALEAASKPELFAELDQRFPNGASDQAIKAHLLTQKFLPDAAEIVIRAYRETKELVGTTGKEYHPRKIGEAEGAFNGMDQGGDAENESALPPPKATHPSGRARPMEGERELTTGLLSKDASFRLIVSGKVGEKEIERLIRKLELDKEILAEAASEPSHEVSEE